MYSRLKRNLLYALTVTCVEEQFNVLSASESIGNVEIYNLLGQKSFSSDLRDNMGTIDISNLSQGIYIMNVAIDEKIGTYKIIKE